MPQVRQIGCLQRLICSDAVQDCLFLGLVIVASLALYVHSLGFYSDDWAFLGLLHESRDQSFAGLFAAVYTPNMWMRPVHALYLTALYWLFGLQPFGYHAVNAAVLVSIGTLSYMVLRELGQPRALALAGPLVYALLPNYSTDRFWYAAFQATLSMALYLLSLYAGLRAVRACLGVWGWQALSVLTLILSIFAYEVVLPLFILNLALVWYRSRQIRTPALHRGRSGMRVAILLLTNAMALVLVLIVKVRATTRLGHETGSLGVGHIMATVRQALSVNYGVYGIYELRTLGRIVPRYPSAVGLTLGAALGLVIFVYAYRIAGQAQRDRPMVAVALRFVVAGAIVFGLGYAVFLYIPIGFTSTGIDNRVAIAAAAGVALSMVGGVALACRLVPSCRWGRALFCLIITAIATSSFLINNTLARFWIAAYRQEQRIVAAMHGQMPTLPAGSTVLLDGVCPYDGPAIIFDSTWDFQGAMWVYYADETLRADVVRPGLKVRQDGVYTSFYGVEYRYPYKNLIIYHFGRRLAYRVPDEAAARSYFQTFDRVPDNGCVRGTHGSGASVI